jgi:hypothetical protein
MPYTFSGFKYRFEDVTVDSVPSTFLQISEYDNFFNAFFSVFNIKREDYSNEKYTVSIKGFLPTTTIKTITIFPKHNPTDELIPVVFTEKSLTVYTSPFSSYEHTYPDYSDAYDADIKSIFDFLSTY